MYTDEVYDVFIAYHGDDKTGSEGVARQVYNEINGKVLYKDRVIKAFFKPESLPYGNFSDTPRIVARTPLFLLVVNKNIPINKSGQIAERDKNGQTKYLFNEIKAFRDSVFNKNAPNGFAAKLLISDDMDFAKANLLDPLFSGTEAFLMKGDYISNLIGWIKESLKYYVTNIVSEIPLNNDASIKNETLVDWDQERAKTWHNMKPPSRPSKSEIDIYRRYFELVKKNKEGPYKPNVLILGSTVEFRKLAIEQDFSVTVVDYSKPYHDEISKELQDIDLSNENYVNCDWCEMDSFIKDRKFNIIIGDLSIGNIAPQSLPKFIKNVADLLIDGGYFLGKSIYKYSTYSINAEQIKNLLHYMAESDDINEDNLYYHIMYPLTIFASYPCDKEGKILKVDFKALYRVIADLPDNESRRKFSIYLSENTKFNTKMPRDFYVYDYRFLIDCFACQNMLPEDVIYSNEIYKNDFPLIIIRKHINEVKEWPTIDSFLCEVDEKYLESWRKSISSTYFLCEYGFIKYDTLKDYVISLLSNAPIKIDKQLNYFLAQIPEQYMYDETQSLTNNTELSDKEELKKELQFNYTCGLLVKLIYSYVSVSKNGEGIELLNFILRTLFNNKSANKIWKPYDSPWVSARICICLYPIYIKWLKHKKSVSGKEVYMNNLKQAVTILALKNIKETKMFWESETGSHFDTSALCIEMIYLYGKQFDTGGVNIEDKVNLILNEYMRQGRVKETFIRFPIYYSLIDQVCNKEKINGKPAFKKLCGRIEWYTILYIVCKDWGKSKNDGELLDISDYIADQLKCFWRLFVERSKEIIDSTIEEEKSIVPQILFCLKRTKLFG